MAGAPVSVDWEGVVYEVVDEPTQLGSRLGWLIDARVTHPPREVLAWRFTGRSDVGSCLVFDVKFDEPRGSWSVINTYS